jgi:3-phytase
MDMCSFDTVARTENGSELSPFCALFVHKEWAQYDYIQSPSKYYGYGAGNTLGPAQGIGFANELVARLTNSPVQDYTSTSTTLDSNPQTFPLDAILYADFSHDNPIILFFIYIFYFIFIFIFIFYFLFFAMGLYNSTQPLSQTAVETIAQTDRQMGTQLPRPSLSLQGVLRDDAVPGGEPASCAGAGE